MPLAMCASTGGVPQWYMNTPGSFAWKEKENDLPGITLANALSGAIRAAWKSIECGIAPPFVSVTFTVWPWRTWITGPGAPPSNVQPLNFTPGAICSVTSLSVMRSGTTLPACSGGSVASYGLCALASVSAFAGT